MLRKLYVEPTTKCNLNCKMCFRHTWFDEPICDLNLDAIAAANPNAKIVKFDGLNHLFQHCTTGLPTEYGNIEETIAPEVIDEIVGFITTFAAAK